MKKATEENVSLERELHALLQVQESVLSTMLKKSVSRKEAIIAFLLSHTELPSDVLTISNQKIIEGTFGVVSIGHITILNSLSAVKEGKHSRHSYVIFEARVFQSLVGCEYFPCIFGVFDGKLVMELITCEDNKVVKVSSMQKESKLTSADWNSTLES